MVSYGKIYSSAMPEPMTIDDYSVWVNTNIAETSVTDENGTQKAYSYTQVRYDKDEYIKMQAEQITEIQLALVELGGE